MNRKQRLKKPERILIIRLSAIGDVLLTTLLIRIIKNKFPLAEIDFLVKKAYEPLVRENPYLNRVLIFSKTKGFVAYWKIGNMLRRSRYDYVIDLQTNVRSLYLRHFAAGQMTVCYTPMRWRRFLLVHFKLDLYGKIDPVPLRYLRPLNKLGIYDDGGGLDLNVDESALRSIESALNRKGLRNGEKIIIIAPGASRGTKRWPAQRFSEIGNHFMSRGDHVILVGGIEDLKTCETVMRGMKNPPWNFTGQLSIQETSALISKSTLVVSNDTGVMHIGAALGKKVVAIFGPTTKQLGFFPFRTQSCVVEANLSCRPCSFHGTDSCPKGHFMCMKQICSGDVIKAAEELLRDKP